ncbi:hypothetical protein F4778DRAFT_744450 [Xylariomycetidae sp. FL2044]|nr:hypothetical protein F4778DRAFT_744450 [Xylariomycetidae sp. FL2044]
MSSSEQVSPQDLGTVFTFPAAALALALEQNNHLYVLQLAESPVVHMIFREFVRDCWSFHPDITHEIARDAAVLFQSSSSSSSDTAASWSDAVPPPPDAKHGWGVEMHIAHFMGRCYGWVQFRHPELGALFARDVEARTRALFGVLGACLRVLMVGRFPEGPLEHDGAVEDALVRWNLDYLGNELAYRANVIQIMRDDDGAALVDVSRETGWFRDYLALLPEMCELCGWVEPDHSFRCLSRMVHLRINQ